MLITIGHTYGSGGLEIGRRLAARLEIPCGDAESDEGAVRSLAGRGSCVVGRDDLTVDSGPLGVSGTVELLSQFIALKTMRRRSKEAAHAGTTD